MHSGSAWLRDDVDQVRLAPRLHRVEVEELGDVRGKSLLHLQCHFGLDTLSWARRGASVTGVDFSPKAIALARSLAVECGIAATFIESNVYQLPERLDVRGYPTTLILDAEGRLLHRRTGELSEASLKALLPAP